MRSTAGSSRGFLIVAAALAVLGAGGFESFREKAKPGSGSPDAEDSLEEDAGGAAHDGGTMTTPHDGPASEDAPTNPADDGPGGIVRDAPPPPDDTPPASLGNGQPCVSNGAC